MENDGPVTAWLRRAARELSAAAFICGVVLVLLAASDKRPVSAGQAAPFPLEVFVVDQPAGGQATPPTLAQTLSAEYPGDYDDLSDQALKQLVLAKHPHLVEAIRMRYPGFYDSFTDQELEQLVLVLLRSGAPPLNSAAGQPLERAAADAIPAFLWELLGAFLFGAMVGAVPLWVAYRFARFVIGR
jgi:hypothetical protein